MPAEWAGRLTKLTRLVLDGNSKVCGAVPDGWSKLVSAVGERPAARGRPLLMHDGVAALQCQLSGMQPCMISVTAALCRSMFTCAHPTLHTQTCQ